MAYFTEIILIYLINKSTKELFIKPKTKYLNYKINFLSSFILEDNYINR